MARDGDLGSRRAASGVDFFHVHVLGNWTVFANHFSCWFFFVNLKLWYYEVVMKAQINSSHPTVAINWNLDLLCLCSSCRWARRRYVLGVVCSSVCALCMHCLHDVHVHLDGGVLWLACCQLLVSICYTSVSYRDSVDNTVEENSNVFSFWMHWLPWARACKQ